MGIFTKKKTKTPNTKHFFFWNKLYVKVCQTAILLMEYSPLTINVISYNQYLCVKLEFENYLLLKKRKKTSKIICKTAILYYYIKMCVCVDFAILFLLYYTTTTVSLPTIFGNAKFVNKKQKLL